MKKFIAIILITLMFFAFAACGKNNTNLTDSTATTAETPDVSNLSAIPEKTTRLVKISQNKNFPDEEDIYVDRETRVMYIERVDSSRKGPSGLSVLYGADGLPLIYEGEIVECESGNFDSVLRLVEISSDRIGSNSEVVYVDRETRVMYIKRSGRSKSSSRGPSGLSVLYDADRLPLLYEGEIAEN